MNERLRRLAIAFSLTTFIVFGSWAGYSYYQYRGLQSYIESQLNEENEVRRGCMDSDQLPSMKFLYCTRLKGFTEAGTNPVTPLRNEYYFDARMGLWLAIGLPGLAFFLLFVSQWVMIGKIRNS